MFSWKFIWNMINVIFTVVPKVVPWKRQYVFWTTMASVVPKRNKRLMTSCYFWVRSASVLPKCNIGSLIHCYLWVRQMPIVPKLHVYQIFLSLPKTLLRSNKTNKHVESSKQETQYHKRSYMCETYNTYTFSCSQKLLFWKSKSIV